jgi:hypothetical protein
MVRPEAIVSWGRLRVHLVLRSGSRSLLQALSENSRYHFATVDDEGPEERVMFVRDPVDRIASAHSLIGKGQPFGEWLEKVLADPMADPHTWPQAEWVGPHNPTILPVERIESFLAERGYNPLRINVSPAKAKVSDAQREAIRAVYAADCAIYGRAA